ncbi:DUF2272 domain-containing protein [Falsiroseomonas sp. CW058]|uniref:DUF2272 domain-containing protein n=1 Tax=Falsiroseomonas sp. CW058 TaxID=3388664 RepID=UPI003D3131D3
MRVGGIRAAGLGALAALLSACAAPVAPQADPPLPYPPAAAERVLRIALAEWRDWGAVTREAHAPGPPAGLESDPANFPRVLAYWTAVPVDFGAIPDNRRRYAAALAGGGAAGLWATPYWSAAFVSWVFRSAGVDAREFPPNATHALYLDALIADARRFPATAPFIPRAPEEHAPRPGDLLCFDRSRAPLRHWTDRLAETGAIRPMHCDIVLATPPGAVEAVGGNVADAVAMTRFPAGPDGRLLPPPPGFAPTLLIMESRLGRLPPWSAR